MGRMLEKSVTVRAIPRSKRSIYYLYYLKVFVTGGDLLAATCEFFSTEQILGTVL